MARPWMPLYVADYLADTGHLRTIEHGAYLLLIMHYWQNGSLPHSDEAQLARIARMTPKEWSGSRATLAAMFGEDWGHKRIDQELAKAESFLERQRGNGRKGGRPKNPAVEETETQTKPKENPPDSSGETQKKARAPASQSQSHSVPNGTAADAAGDLTKLVFTRGLAWLQAETGKPEAACRSLLGKWRRDYGDEALISVLGRAQRHGPVDAIPWIEAAFRESERRTPAKQGFNF